MKQNKPKKNIGPASADLLQALTSYDLRALTFGRSAFVPLEGTNVHVARGGYTGEDGFEVSLPNHLSLAPFPFQFLS
jgi:glycine cleavage system aminomethyltransferase T